MATSIGHRPNRELARFGSIAVTESGIVGDVLMGTTLALYDVQRAFRYAQACFHPPISDCVEEHDGIAFV